MIDLLSACKRYSLPYRQIVEVGVNQPQLTHLREFFTESVFQKAILVEPLVEHARGLRERFQTDQRVSVVCAAVCDVNLPVEMYYADQSTFLADLDASPAIMNSDEDPRRAERKFAVQGITFDRIDDGQIDVLTADVEGAEWYILKHMVSRPGLICLETHLTGHPYINPFMSKIRAWMQHNGYIQIDNDMTDTVWRKGVGPNY